MQSQMLQIREAEHKKSTSILKALDTRYAVVHWSTRLRKGIWPAHAHLHPGAALCWLSPGWELLCSFPAHCSLAALPLSACTPHTAPAGAEGRGGNPELWLQGWGDKADALAHLLGAPPTPCHPASLRGHFMAAPPAAHRAAHILLHWQVAWRRGGTGVEYQPYHAFGSPGCCFRIPNPPALLLHLSPSRSGSEDMSSNQHRVQQEQGLPKAARADGVRLLQSACGGAGEGF